ncbi:DUF3429 domain-containing protein [uncultured Sulfitobacter sp.]|uniref:DUF3429 domain-containing protein n=1 Tax=uncultured Sulfitobacter sp. TaxID=191468 RepID=UPI00260D0691|nr:DUF3429 domain-containing protein [uncultured Sulfitobacter sp.]
MSRIPAPALLLGIAGLIPFVWAALLILGLSGGREANLPPALSGDGRLIMIRYGGIILPFMSGVLWGFATKASGGRAVAAYALSVLPALWWFFMPGTGAVSALTNLATGFLAVLILDFFFHRWNLTPGWWMTLRIQLTVIVLICLAIGIWA